MADPDVLVRLVDLTVVKAYVCIEHAQEEERPA
jgi:hypothetical protein